MKKIKLPNFFPYIDWLKRKKSFIVIIIILSSVLLLNVYALMQSIKKEHTLSMVLNAFVCGLLSWMIIHQFLFRYILKHTYQILEEGKKKLEECLHTFEEKFLYQTDDESKNEY
jgi:RsiW-degrading membrane proteinase PrsW (M82 family)